MKKLLKKIAARLTGKLSEKRGLILVIVVGFISLMAVNTMIFTTVIKGDIDILGRVKLVTQAQNVAEAGLHHALSRLKEDGYDMRSDLNGSLDTGSYKVKFKEADDRILISSTGTVLGVTRTAALEVRNTTPTSLYYAITAGSKLVMKTATGGDVSVSGDIHSNYMVDLRAVGGRIDIEGDVSSCGKVQEGSRYNRADAYDIGVEINGFANDGAQVLENRFRESFPVFYYSKYMAEAKSGGSYYSRNTTFTDKTLTPVNGLVYVNGTATFNGRNFIYGGIVATDITINGEFYQKKAGERNIIAARTKSIKLGTVFSVEEALVYAKLDIRNKYVNSSVDVTGVVAAEREVNLSGLTSSLKFTHELTCPSDLLSEVGDPSETIEVVSWNK